MKKSAVQAQSVHVLADIGGTNVRFAYVIDGSASLQCIIRFSCSDYERFEDALNVYLKMLAQNSAVKPTSACIAVAACVLEDVIQLTNSAWQFSRAQLSATLGIPVFILNDFGAQAYALAELTDEQIDWWQHGAPSQTLEHAATHTRSIVGPGTGFGGASLLPSGEVLNSEPGHVSFAPVSSHEAQLLALLWQRYPRVSVEHLLSGPGLANLYWANAALQGKTQTLDANLIVEGAKRGDALCLQVIQDFTGILGSVCGDIALSTGSLSGVFLSGAIVEKIDSLFDKGLFMTRFTDKGPFTHWCRQLPVGRFVCEYPGLMGCAAFSRELHV